VQKVILETNHKTELAEGLLHAHPPAPGLKNRKLEKVRLFRNPKKFADNRRFSEDPQKKINEPQKILHIVKIF